MIRRRDEIYAAQVEDRLLMMHVERGSYHSLDAVGTRIWELLAEPTTEEAVVSRLLEEYAVAPEVCRRDVGAFIAGLRERGLVVDAG